MSPGEKNNEDQEIRGKFHNLKNANPFLVPEGYFEQLPDSIKMRMHERTQAKHRSSRFKLILLGTSGMAAAVAAFLIMFYFVMPAAPDEAGQAALSELTLTAADIEDYLSYTEGISEEDILEVMLSNGVASSANSPGAGNPDSIAPQKTITGTFKRDTSITDEDILDYLTDEEYEPEL